MLEMESALPLYAQIKELVIRQIRSGKYKPHELLPAERVFTEQFGVSRITVRRALNDLANEGIVYRKPGLGTFVGAQPIVETLSELLGHLEELQGRGLGPEVTMLEQRYGDGPHEAHDALGNPQSLLFTRRLVRVEGIPLLVLDVCLPGDIGAYFDAHLLTQTPVHTLLERLGLIPYAGEQRMTARAVLQWEADLLQVLPGSPALEVIRSEWSAAGRGLVWSRALYRSDRYQYIIRLNRRGPRA